MQMDQLNKWLTLAANIGVIAGIVFLAVELRQNSDMIRAQSRTDMAQGGMQLMTLNVNDKVYVETMLRGWQGGELDEVEADQLFRTLSAWTTYWNNIAYLHDRGLYDEAEFALQMSVVRGELEHFPGWKSFMCDNRYASNDALISAIDEAADGGLCE